MGRNGMPMAMWAVFAKSFEKQLTEVFSAMLKPQSNPKDRKTEYKEDHRKAA